MISPPPPPQLLPEGFAVSLDPEVRWLDGATLIGGTPRRRIRLSAAGVRALTAISAGEAASASGRQLACRLLDAGVLHPRPQRVPGPLDVTVVIPVRDRPARLDQALASLTEAVRVVVVDDGSKDPAVVRQIAAAHGAEVLRRDRAGGPAAARNAGAAAIDSAFTAFMDSDCQAPPGWLSELVGHFQDPTVAAVAPRIRPAEVHGSTVVSRYLELRSPLDMGSVPGPVGPARRVRYLPSAALILRTAALGTGFDEELRFGEDVDLIWRLNDGGWQIRYDPNVVVTHHEPLRLCDVLRRRFNYGTSAGPLGARHGQNLAPAILSPEVAVASAALLAGRPKWAGALGAAAFTARVRLMRDIGLGRDRTMAWSGAQLAAEAIGAARFLGGPGLPATLALLRRRPVTGTLVMLAPGLADLRERARQLPPLTLLSMAVLDDATYGAGVVVGSLRSRSAAALQPRVTASTVTPWRRAHLTSSTLTTVSKAAGVRYFRTRPGTPRSGSDHGRASDQALDPAFTAAGAGSFVEGRSGG